MSDIPFSATYLHDLRTLYTEREEKRITDEEFSRRSDQLKQREAQLHESLGSLLLRQELVRLEKEVADEVKRETQQQRQQEADQERATKEREAFLERQRLQNIRDEARKQQQKAQQEQAKVIREQKQREQARIDYKAELTNYVDRLERSAQDWQFRYTWLQIILLFFSAITATMAGIEGIPRWVVAVTGVIATIAGSLLTTFKIQDRIYASRKAIAEVRLERQKYDYHIEDYAKLNEEEAFIHFSRNITSIQGQQMIQEVELWKPNKDEPKDENRSYRNSQEEQTSKPEQEAEEKTPPLENNADQNSTNLTTEQNGNVE